MQLDSVLKDMNPRGVFIGRHTITDDIKSIFSQAGPTRTPKRGQGLNSQSGKIGQRFTSNIDCATVAQRALVEKGQGMQPRGFPRGI